MGAADMSKLFVNKNGVFTHGMRQELYKPFVAIAVCDNIDDVVLFPVRHYFKIFG